MREHSALEKAQFRTPFEFVCVFESEWLLSLKRRAKATRLAACPNAFTQLFMSFVPLWCIRVPDAAQVEEYSKVTGLPIGNSC